MTTELAPFAEITVPRSDPGSTPPPDPALGRLVVIADWMSARRDRSGAFRRPRVVVLAGDHGGRDGDPGAASSAAADLESTERLADALGVGVVRVDVAHVRHRRRCRHLRRLDAVDAARHL